MRYTSARMVSAASFSGDMAGSLLYDSTQALNLGTSAATSHALGTGDVLVGGDLEVNGVLYVDNSVFVPNGSEVHAGNSYLGNNQVVFASGPNRIMSIDRSGSEPSLAISMYTGDATNVGDYPSGDITIYTGATTTDGDTGDITLYTGAAGAGAADAGDIVLGVNGPPNSSALGLRIEGSTGAVVIGGNNAYGPAWGGVNSPNNARMYYNEGASQLLLGVGIENGRQFIITESNNVAKGHFHAVATDPLFVIHSATDPTGGDPNQFVSVEHDKTNGVVTVGKGALHLDIANATISHSGGIKTGLTDASANDLVAIAMPLSSHVSGRLNIAVHADDGTDFQIRRTTVLFAAVRVAGGGITIDTQVAAASSAAALSGGTLSVTVASADNGDGTFKLTVTPNSSLTPTTLEAHYWVELDEDYVLTQY